jgi:F0F1-type ATP synthase epsilon subunit
MHLFLVGLSLKYDNWQQAEVNITAQRAEHDRVVDERDALKAQLQLTQVSNFSSIHLLC